MSVAYRVIHVPSLFSEGVDGGLEQTPSQLRAARERLLGETIGARLARVARVALAMLSPRRLLNIVIYLDLMTRDRVVGADTLPDPASALPRPDGFCGAARDLSAPTLMQAYAQGLHARAPLSAASWWSPPVRRLRDLRAAAGRVAAERALFDSQHDGVIANCARAALRRDPLAALTPELRRAHSRLLDRGYAHAWRVEGAEGYGVVIGGVFIVLGLSGGRDGAHRAMRALEHELRRRNFSTLDVTIVADALDADFGAKIPRADYLDMLANSPNCDGALRWR